MTDSGFWRCCQLTPFGLRRVTLVIPLIGVNPSLAMDFRAFFSLRLWTATWEPAGMLASPSAASSPASSESEESEASSAVVLFLVSSWSSGNSSIRDDILKVLCV